MRKLKDTFLESFDLDNSTSDREIHYSFLNIWYQFPYFDITLINEDYVNHYNKNIDTSTKNNNLNYLPFNYKTDINELENLNIKLINLK